MLIKKIKSYTRVLLVLASIAFSFITCKEVFAAIDNYYPKIAVVGDSYTKQFQQTAGYDRFEYYLYKGDTIFEVDNVKSTFGVMEHYTYVVFLIGAEPYLLSVDRDLFYKYIKNYVESAKNHGNFVFLPSYMDFKGSRAEGKVTTSEDIDNIYKKIAGENANVFYIDMKNFSNNGSLQQDKMNYNELFYQTLYAKIIYWVDSIDKEFYKKSSDVINNVNGNVIAVAGDSYAGTFVRFEKDKKYNLLEFAKAGKTIGQNAYLIDAAIETIAKYILIATSVNDFEKQTTLNAFETNMRKYLNHALKNHRVVFLHTYMNYAAAKKRTIKIEDYDAILKKLAEEYDNTLYVDMHDLEKEEFQMPDKRHYDKAFNDLLYERIDELIKSIRK